MVLPAIAAGAGRVVAGTVRVDTKSARRARGRRSNTATPTAIKLDQAALKAPTRGAAIRKQREVKQSPTSTFQRGTRDFLTANQQRQRQSAYAALQRKKEGGSTLSKLRHRARVMRIFWIVTTMYLPAYGLQVAFGILYFGVEQLSILGGLADQVGVWITGISTKMMAQVIIAVIGIIAMTGAIFMCLISRVNLHSSAAVIGAAVALGGYIAPGFFFLPWVLFWLFLVFLVQ